MPDKLDGVNERLDKLTEGLIGSKKTRTAGKLGDLLKMLTGGASSLLSMGLNFLTGNPIGTIGKGIKSALSGVSLNTLFSGIIAPALLLGGFSGKFDDIVSKLGEFVNGEDTDSALDKQTNAEVEDEDGNKVELQMDENGEPIYDLLIDNQGKKLYDTLQNYINEVKDKKDADYVILLAHFGLNGTEDYTSDLLLKNLEGVDAVLDGHTHLVYNSTTKDKTNKVIHLTQSGTKLQSIGMLILKKDGSIISENIDKVPAPEDIEGSKIIKRGGKERWVNTEMNEFINSVWDEYKDELNSFIGKSYFDLIVKPGDSHHTTCRIEECTIGNIVADAVKDAGYAECSILASNSFKDNIYKGDITWGKIINILPYFNSIFVKQLPGQIILDSLEAGVSKLPDYSSQFPQVSGITFDVDSNVTSPVITDENGIFVKIEGSRRVSNVKINGKSLDLNKIYTVSLSDYIANGGNGLYNMFTKYEVFNQSFLTDSDATSYFIKNNLNGKIPKKYKEKQGRINIDGKNRSSEDKSYFNSSKTILIISVILIIIRFIAYLKRY
jgi:Skp family chaperone for outer membrane proteins